MKTKQGDSLECMHFLAKIIWMTVIIIGINVIVVCCLIEVLPVQVDTIIEEDEENTIKGRIHLSG